MAISFFGGKEMKQFFLTPIRNGIIGILVAIFIILGLAWIGWIDEATQKAIQDFMRVR